VIGRYILSPQVMSNLNKIKSGAGGEIQLTDAIAREIETSDNVYGFRFRGQRFDCGSKAGFLQATVAFGMARDDLRDELHRVPDRHAVGAQRRAVTDHAACRTTRTARWCGLA
jgi:UTP--glucose-1-phosphate uridylyltransferase